MAPICGPLKEVPIYFDGQSTPLDSFVVHEMPVDMVIRTPILKQLEA